MLLIISALVLNACTGKGDHIADLGRPNILFMMSDDHAYQAISAYDDRLITTPNIDRLAKEGMVFTDAHSGSAVCTPTRYGILTGRYCWRSRLKRGVLGGYSPALVEPNRRTVASLLKRNGYTTLTADPLLDHIQGREAASKHIVHLAAYTFEYLPVESHTVAAGQRA